MRFWRWLTCTHKNLRGVYGDEIIFTAGWRRIACTDCGKYLNRPLTALGDPE